MVFVCATFRWQQLKMHAEKERRLLIRGSAELWPGIVFMRDVEVDYDNVFMVTDTMDF